MMPAISHAVTSKVTVSSMDFISFLCWWILVLDEGSCQELYLVAWSEQSNEETAAHCEFYKTTIAMPKLVTKHPQQLPNGPWERVHVDYGEWNNRCFLVPVNAFSKWTEVKLTFTTQPK